MTDLPEQPDDDEVLRAHARLLMPAGVAAATHVNDQIFNQPEFRAVSNETMLIAMVCLAAGFAKAVSMPTHDFAILCEVAFDSISADVKAKGDK